MEAHQADSKRSQYEMLLVNLSHWRLLFASVIVTLEALQHEGLFFSVAVKTLTLRDLLPRMLGKLLNLTQL